MVRTRRPPLCNCCVTPMDTQGENARSSAPSVPKPHSVPQVCSEQWSKKAKLRCCHATAAIVGKSRNINWRTPECRVTGRRPLDANYGSLEAFTRAYFRKAFRTSPSLYRRMRVPHFTCRRPTKFTFLPLVSSTKGGRDMDLFDRFAGQRLLRTRGVCWNTRVL